MARPVYELKAELFKTLGHPARIRILEALRSGESTVAGISEAIGISGSTLAQHLATLRRANVVSSRRDGSLAIYEVVDPGVFQLLETGRRMLTTSLSGSAEILADLEQMTYRDTAVDDAE